ncbi:pyruvoyl-dependent arginine decarboxylase [Bdellovibrionota bacterium]
MAQVPKKMFFTKGVGIHFEKLTSFELALRSAGIAELNLVKVSSIFPPGCKVVNKSIGQQELEAGSIVHCVMAEASTNEPNRLIASSIGVAIPDDKKQWGYLSEHHCYGMTQKAAGDYAEDLAAYMLATTLGIDFEDKVKYDEETEIWKMQKKIVKTREITQTAVGPKDGKWCTVIASGVFIN